MSRIGKSPLSIPSGVTVALEDNTVTVKGAKGNLSFPVPQGISVHIQDNILTVENHRNDRKSKALHGLTRAHVGNMVKGVTEGWSKSLELSGVGYRAALQGVNLVLNVGFSHQVTITPPPGITFAIVEGKIVVSGIDRQQVGQIAANVRAVKKPEPYKGKGIKYVGEVIRKKAGKSAKAIGGAGGGK